MSIFAVYPDARATKKINEQFPNIKLDHFGMEISEITRTIEETYGLEGLEGLGNIFSFHGKFLTAADLAAGIINLKGSLSPGVMSNAPDRLDGFHTYNACCRSVSDTGRHSSNLSRYATDRRAYENWADGDWRGADRLMGKYHSSTEMVECPSCGNIAKMSADHIGPISLGFMHRMDFRPLCIQCNSKKNNRMTLKDIEILNLLESQGEEVISWHSKAIWNLLKLSIDTEQQALKVSKILRKNMHFVMCILSTLYNDGFKEFLETYLHPEYAAFDFKFSKFDISTGDFLAERISIDSLNTQKQAFRYIRVSFEALEDYAEKENRNSTRWVDDEVDEMLIEVKRLVKSGSTSEAKALVNEILERLALGLATSF